MTTDTVEEENHLVSWAREELQRAGLFNEESDFDGEIGHIVINMLKEFSKYGHSGGSASLTIEVLDRLIRFKPLGPLTNDPEEWNQIHDGLVGPDEPPLWQSRRNGSCFSHDGGKTFYDIEEPLQPNGVPTIFNSKEHNSA